MPRCAVASLAAALFLALAGCGGSGGGGSAASTTSGAGTTSTSTHGGHSHRPAPGPAPLPTGPPLKHHDRPVPILMYHVVAPPPAGAPYPELYVRGRTFRREMQALSRAGYHGITMAQLAAYWDRGVRLPHKPVVVSFDDGYHSVYAHALPVLQALRWPGVLNLELRVLGQPGNLSRSNVAKLAAAGWEVDSHTINHPDLRTVDDATLRTELVVSRSRIRRLFNQAAQFFCYPAGKYDDRVVAAVKAAGYLGATTTDPGIATPGDRFRLARVRVNGSDTPASLLARLRAGGGGGAGGGPA